MSSTDTSNQPTAESYQQEDQDFDPQLAGGGSTNGVRGAHNSLFQQGSTATVFLGAASGSAAVVTANLWAENLVKQHLIYGDKAKGTSTVVLPRKVHIWGAPGQILTARFNEINTFLDVNQSRVQVNQTKQFYSIGLEGAQRPEISFTWRSNLVANNPWQAGDTATPFFSVAGTTETGATGGPWFCQLTCTIYNTELIAALPVTFMIDQETVDYGKRKREEEKAREVKRIKDLTLPATME